MKIKFNWMSHIDGFHINRRNWTRGGEWRGFHRFSSPFHGGNCYIDEIISQTCTMWRKGSGDHLEQKDRLGRPDRLRHRVRGEHDWWRLSNSRRSQPDSRRYWTRWLVKANAKSMSKRGTQWKQTMVSFFFSSVSVHVCCIYNNYNSSDDGLRSVWRCWWFIAHWSSHIIYHCLPVVPWCLSPFTPFWFSRS